MMTSPTMLVVGAGSWGTALAMLLARNGVNTRLWGNVASEMQVMLDKRSNPFYLPDITFPEKLVPFIDLDQALQDVQDIFIVVPSHAFTQVLIQLKANVDPTNTRIIWATKGLEPTTNQCLHEIVRQYFGDAIPMAVLSGPSFAREVAQQLPTVVALVSNQQAFTDALCARFNSDCFHVYPHDDFIGVAIAGAVKNVIAIATGMSDGLGFGANARAGIITGGLHEAKHLGIAMGAKAETFHGLAGLGDLVLTCTDNQSRNRRFGIALGQGKSISEAQRAIGQVVEGLHNTQQVVALAKKHHITMPIVAAIEQIIAGKLTPQVAAKQLISHYQ